MVGRGGCAVPSRSEVSVGYRQGQPDGVWAGEGGRQQRFPVQTALRWLVIRREANGTLTGKEVQRMKDLKDLMYCSRCNCW